MRRWHAGRSGATAKTGGRKAQASRCERCERPTTDLLRVLVSQVMDGLLRHLVSNMHLLLRLVDNVALLDVLLSFAQHAALAPPGCAYARPQLLDGGRTLNLVQVKGRAACSAGDKGTRPTRSRVALQAVPAPLLTSWAGAHALCCGGQEAWRCPSGRYAGAAPAAGAAAGVHRVRQRPVHGRGLGQPARHHRPQHGACLPGVTGCWPAALCLLGLAVADRRVRQSVSCAAAVGGCVVLQAGKTTTLKTVGLLVVMAQAGCLVPALSMQLSPVRQLFTHMVHGDCLESNLSSFQVECTVRRADDGETAAPA